MQQRRYLIVNADDFGLSPNINRGIIHAHEHGIVTSASFMVRWPAAVEAAAYGRSHPSLGLGLHVDLGEWTCRGGEWVQVYKVVATNDADAVSSEIYRQLDLFRTLLRSEPTHLDSHQHVHRAGPVLTVMRELAQSLGIPLREFTPSIRYCGDFYGQLAEGKACHELLTPGALINVLGNLKPGVTELACHPGLEVKIDSMYRIEREIELKTLCDPAVRAFLDSRGILLRSFASLEKTAETTLV